MAYIIFIKQALVYGLRKKCASFTMNSYTLIYSKLFYFGLGELPLDLFIYYYSLKGFGDLHFHD